MEKTNIYRDIALRTGGDIYIGVVGPVRTGKSTFIKRFMETLVIPNIENVYERERARDELPQSASGKTIMTAEPKFVPEEAVTISLGENTGLSVRLVDSVGYMVEGALGHEEDGRPRMVSTPWADGEMPMAEAAKIGTRKVIGEHSTIGVVITTDGTVSDLSRSAYLSGERLAIEDMKATGKSFVVLLNTLSPESEASKKLAESISAEHSVSCIAVNCQKMSEADIIAVLKSILFEFPISGIDIFMPSWVMALEGESGIKTALLDRIYEAGKAVGAIKDAEAFAGALREFELVDSAAVSSVDLGRGKAEVRLDIPRRLFYETLSSGSGFTINDDGDLIKLLSSLASVKSEYDRVSEAIREVRATGYGIVMPGADELKLDEPEIVRQGGRYGVRLKASAPSIHMILADIETEVSPIVGTEKQSEELVDYLLSEFDEDKGKIWQSNIFGKSLLELVNEGLNSKLKRTPPETRVKFQETLQKIINEGSGGLICIIL